MMQNDRMDDEIDFGRILMVLWDRRNLIGFFTGAVFIAGVILALTAPKVYESHSM
ncbi:hypothetical protein KKH42_01395, partial [bacterium]|nr:hypothetical protein [bacterium]